MGIVDKISKRMAQAEANSKEYPEDLKDSAGRNAELAVARELRPRLAGTGWELVQNIRVADPATRRQRELDFVITAPDRAVVIELKRWSGKVSMRGDDVIQERRNGEQVNHGALFADLADRVELLRHRHLALKRDAVPIQGLVVFYDERGNLRLSDDVASRPDVVDYARLMAGMPESRREAEVDEPSFLSRVLASVLALLGQNLEPLPELAPRPRAATWGVMDLRRTLAEFGTWDVVELHGGRTFHGDILDATGAEHPAIKGVLFNRAATAGGRIDCERGAIGALFGTHDGGATAKAIGRNGFVGEWRLPVDLPIVVQAAGQAAPEFYPAGSVVAFHYGYDKKPKTRFAFEDLSIGMMLTGRVKYLRPRGAFVDIGVDTPLGKHRHAVARPAGPGRASLTVEQAAAWRAVKVGARVLVRVASLDAGGKLAEIDIVDIEQLL